MFKNFNFLNTESCFIQFNLNWIKFLLNSFEESAKFLCQMTILVKNEELSKKITLLKV